MGVLIARKSPIRVSLPRFHFRVGLHIDVFEACSAFTRVAACTLARSPNSCPLSGGFRHLVSSMPAPVASGWSGRRAGLAPAGKAPPCHGARGIETFATTRLAGGLHADSGRSRERNQTAGVDPTPLQHGIRVGLIELELAERPKGTLTHHEVLSRRINIAEAALQRIRIEKC